MADLTDLSDLRELYRRSLRAFIKGDPDVTKPLWSRREDVTLANPLDPPAKGYERVVEVMDRAAAQLRDGEGMTFETISFVETPALAYELHIERSQMKLGDAEDLSPVALRVTTVFRREEDGWKIVHRHADPLRHRPVESIRSAPD